MRRAFSETERQRYLAARSESLDRYNAAMDRTAECVAGSAEESAAVTAAEAHLEVATTAEEQYFDRLPRVVMSCCPFDGKPLVRTFDPYGFDGLWWRPDATPMELPSCPHFCFIRGAVGFGGPPPRSGGFQPNAGPEAPYVIPRILDKPGTVVVISEIAMTPGPAAYVMAYFAQRRPPVQTLAANWPRSIFLYTTAMGQHAWRYDERAWDFDLRPWLARGKVRWCEPGSGNERLSADSSGPCPYVEHLP